MDGQSSAGQHWSGPRSRKTLCGPKVDWAKSRLGQKLIGPKVDWAKIDEPKVVIVIFSACRGMQKVGISWHQRVHGHQLKIRFDGSFDHSCGCETPLSPQEGSTSFHRWKPGELREHRAVCSIHLGDVIRHQCGMVGVRVEKQPIQVLQGKWTKSCSIVSRMI